MILQLMIINLDVSIPSKTSLSPMKILLASSIQNSTMSPTPGQYYDETTYEPYRQHYAQMSGDNQQQTEQQLLHLSLSKFSKFSHR